MVSFLRRVPVSVLGLLVTSVLGLGLAVASLLLVAVAVSVASLAVAEQLGCK